MVPTNKSGIAYSEIIRYDNIIQFGIYVIFILKMILTTFLYIT